MKKAVGLALVAAVLLIGQPASAGCGCGCADKAAFTSANHAFSLSLPAPWVEVPRRGADDLADLRFRHPSEALTGFYQVYEQAVTDKPDAWYDNARARYETAAHSMPTVERVEFSELSTATMGGQPAWSFGFVTVFKSGPPVATRIVFTPRRSGDRVDMHEIVVSGDTAAMAASKEAQEALLEAVRFR